MPNVLVVSGGELANDVMESIMAKKPSTLDISVTSRSAADKPKELVTLEDTLIVFVIQTVENAQPTEDGGSLLRFFKRKTHPEDLLNGKFKYTVLGVGDSNLLLDRQTTTSKDCNQAAQELDSRLAALGSERFCDLGLADERTGLTEVDPWIEKVWAAVATQL